MSESNGHGMLVTRATIVELLALVEAAGRTLAEVSPFELDSFFLERGDEIRRRVFELEGKEWAESELAVMVYAQASEIEAEALEQVDFSTEVMALRGFASELRERQREQPATLEGPES
jgi:hypothetical protein